MGLTQKNILFLHGSSDLYGASKVMLSTIKVFNNGVNKIIVVLSETGPLSEELERQGIEVRIIRLGILRRKYKSISGIANRLNVLRKAFFSLSALIKKEQIDIVYSNTTAVIIGAIVAKAKGVKHIWHVLEIIEKPVFMYRFIGTMLQNLSYKVVATSLAVKNHWAAYVKEEKLVLAYNDIDYTPFLNRQSNLKQELKLPEDCFLIGMIGRVNHWKGQDYFLNIASVITTQFPECYFLMAGSPYPGYEHLADKIKDTIAEKKLEDRAINLGHRNDILNIINGLDIFISPSILPDPFPTVILEAMAAGKPVVATNHGGAPEMIEDNQSGILIPVDDAPVAAQRIMSLIADPVKRKLFGERAGIRVRTRFSYDQYKNTLLKMLE